MFRLIGIALSLMFFASTNAQVKANDSLYTTFNHHNRVDSLYLYQTFKWKNNEFELIGIEQVPNFLFEISSKGGLLNISTPYTSEDYIYKGERKEFLVIKLDTNQQVYHKKINTFMYEESVKDVANYFYYFPDQIGRIYRLIVTKKRSDILIYFISPKD